MFDSINQSDLVAPGLILAAGGLIFLVMAVIAVAQWSKVRAARRWPVAVGTVVESRVAESRDSHGAHFYRPVIQYRYEVAGQVYTGSLLAFGSRSLSEGGTLAEQKAHAAVAKYPAGSQVEVHYHPKRPDQSVPEIRSSVAGWLLLAGVIFLLAGALVAGIVLLTNLAP